MFTREDLQAVRRRKDLFRIAQDKGIKTKRVEKNLRYESELVQLQAELVNLQQWVAKHGKRVAIIFEGRDAAGKGGSIKRFAEHLNPRSMRIVALSTPTENEQGQWYFRRYIKELPNPGEIVFFDRSWYNRAVVEPVNGFCTREQYNTFVGQVNDFERMVLESNVYFIKFYYSITKEEQAKRFAEIKKSPLKKWKMTPVDDRAQELWDDYTMYKEKMMSRTNTAMAPWVVIDANKKTSARITALEHILNVIPYKKRDAEAPL